MKRSGRDLTNTLWRPRNLSVGDARWTYGNGWGWAALVFVLTVDMTKEDLVNYRVIP